MAVDTTLICKRTRVWWVFFPLVIESTVYLVVHSRFLANKCLNRLATRDSGRCERVFVWNKCKWDTGVAVVRNREVAAKVGFLMYYCD